VTSSLAKAHEKALAISRVKFFGAAWRRKGRKATCFCIEREMESKWAPQHRSIEAMHRSELARGFPKALETEFEQEGR